MKIKFLISFLIGMSLQVNAMSDVKIKNYMKSYVEKKMDATVSRVDIISSYPIESAKGWSVYFLSMKVKVKIQDIYNEAILPQTVFVKGNKITLKLMKKGTLKKDGKRKKAKNYAELLKPKVPQEAYDERHLIAGSHYAPHKILIFSDPFCPYCKIKAPEALKIARENPKIYGLYYYHLPLIKIHPAADVTTRAMHIFQKRGEIDNMMALYDLPTFKGEKSVARILRDIKFKTGVQFTKEEIFSEEVEKAIKIDKKMQRR